MQLDFGFRLLDSGLGLKAVEDLALHRVLDWGEQLVPPDALFQCVRRNCLSCSRILGLGPFSSQAGSKDLELPLVVIANGLFRILALSRLQVGCYHRS